jgi:hypothetical protein
MAVRLQGGSCHRSRLLKERKVTDATNFLRRFLRGPGRRACVRILGFASVRAARRHFDGRARDRGQVV